MGQEASVPQRIGDDFQQRPPNNHTSASSVSAFPSKAPNDGAGSSSNASAAFVGSASSSTQPQSQQHRYGANVEKAAVDNIPGRTKSPAAIQQQPPPPLMSRSGISSMIQSAKRLGGRTNNCAGGEADAADDSNDVTMNGDHHSEKAAAHHGELSPQSRAIMMQQQRQILSAHSTPCHTPQGSINTLYNVMYSSAAAAATAGDGHFPRNSAASNSSSDAQTVHTTNVTTAAATATTITQNMTNLTMSSSPKNNDNQLFLQRLATPPSSPRALALNKMKDNDEDDWAKAWAEDTGESDDDDDEEEEEKEEEKEGEKEENEERRTVEDYSSGPSGAPPGGCIGGGALPQPPSVPILQQQQQQHQHAQIPPLPFATTSQQLKPTPPSNSIGIMSPPPPLSTDRISHNALLFTSPQRQQQQQQQHPIIDEEEETKLVIEADRALQKDGGAWDSYCAMKDDDGHDADERPCVEMFNPALRVLGRGSFGRVVLVQKQYGQNQGGLYAMKILRKSHLVRRRQIERTKTERKVLARLDHPFLMKLYYAFQTAEKLFLVLDYCPGGELFFHLSRYRRFQEPVARFYAAELMLAIGHLHKHGVIYRDLKPENVLLDAYGHVKLGDFGLAKDGIRHPTQGAKSTCGTPEYMAPEVLNQQGHGFCVDYWGLGMILFEMMTGLPPWYTTDRAKLFRRLRSAPLIFPNEINFSPSCKTCIAGLLERDPRLRIGVLGLRSAMRHEFFNRKINFEALRARQISAPIRPCEGWRQFQSRSNSIETESNTPGGWHSTNPSLDSTSMGHIASASTGNITAEALDVATANFDDSFRRMPIETEDYEKQQQAQGQPPISEKDLNSQTFRGFTFDGDIPLPEESENSPNDLRGELT